MRSFNTHGQCLPDRHYMLPPAERLPLAEGLIEGGHYIVLHAPRQTGKTTALNTLASRLLAEGQYIALAFSCESASASRDDLNAAQHVILGAITDAANQAGLPDEFLPPDPWPDTVPGLAILYGFREWARRCPKPLVLFFDEIDALVGDGLRSVLAQLRSGYNSRPAPFPHSIAVCGMRNVRDYKEAAGGNAPTVGSTSPFNIAEVLRLGDFSPDDVERLYAQHTGETGQPFTAEAVEQAYRCSRGQPWLVNALAREIIVNMQVAPPSPISAEHVREASKRLILARASHLDSLVARLSEDRVRRVMEPVIAGTYPPADLTYDEDLSYVRDLGLVTSARPTEVANPIYREVILRVLSATTEERMGDVDPRRFIMDDGQLDFDLFLHEFADFWRLHGDVLTSDNSYHEVAPQLVLMAFLQRVVNGGGQVVREYGVGRGRIDLTVQWPYLDPAGKRREQREAIELKVWHPSGSDPKGEGLTQLDGYLDGLGLNYGTLVIFDRRNPGARIADLVGFTDEKTPSGRPVTLLRV